MGTRTDSELVAACVASRDELFSRAQGEAAFAELVSRHMPMVHRVCLRMLNNRQDAEDAAQAAFVVLLRKIGVLKREGDLSSWLYGVARRTALKVLDQRARQVRQEDAAAMWQEDLGEQTVDESTREQALACLDVELAALPSAQRQAVILRYLKGHSQEDAARLAGCPLGTLTQRASRAIARLGARLSKRGLTLGGTAIVGLLTSEASAAIPETLIPSVLATAKIAAATTAATAAAASPALMLAEGVVKAMFYAKLQMAAAVVVTVAVVSGSAVAVTNTVAELGIGIRAQGSAGANTVPRGTERPLAAADSKGTLNDAPVSEVKGTVRALLIAGEPNRDYLCLADVLPNTPGVNLSCWLQTADIDYVQQGKVPIRRFPESPTEWDQYDLCILCDPDPNKLNSRQVTGIESMVRQGGGLVVIAGRNHGMAKLLQVHGGKVRDMLPVEIDKNTLPIYFDNFEKILEIEPAPGGVNHAIMRISGNPGQNGKIWSAFPGPYWSQPVLGAKAGATVLLQSRRADQVDIVMAAQPYGEGKVLFVGMSDLWRWRCSNEAAYKRFWALAMNYLGKDMAGVEHKGPEEGGIASAERTIPAATVGVIGKALSFLVAAQNADGSWSDAPDTNRTTVTALACLAFMAEGSQPRAGRYGTPLAKGIESLLKNVQSSGIIGEKASLSPMLEHVWALQALLNAMGETPWQPQMRSVLEKGVEVVRKDQRADGGWGSAIPSLEGNSDPELTAEILRTLRLANRCGFTITSGVLSNAARFVEQSGRAAPVQLGEQRPDGAFSDEKGNTVSPTAKALIALQAPCGYLPTFKP